MSRITMCLIGILWISWGLLSADEGETKPARQFPAEAPQFDPIAQKIADDWDRLQGHWERSVPLPNNQKMKLVKTITEHSESVKGYDQNGQLLREQVADLSIEIRGNLHVLRWSNARVVAGAGQGTKISDGTAVIQFKDGNWISVNGLADDEKWSVYVEEWTRGIGDQ